MRRLILVAIPIVLFLVVAISLKKNAPLEEVPDFFEQTTETVTIDTHVHLQGSDLESAATELIADMDTLDVDIAIIISVPGKSQNEAETEASARSAVALYPDRLRSMAGGAMLGRMMQSTPETEVTANNLAEFKTQAQELIDDDLVVGFGEMLAMHLCMNEAHSYQEVMPNHPFYLALADIAAAQDVPIDIHMEAVLEDMPMPESALARCSKNPPILKATIEPFKQLLAHNPDANIVWQHIGWDNTGFMTPELMRELLTEFDNLFLSLRVTQATQGPNRIIDSNGTITQEWLKLFIDFPDHFMLGSDQFVGDLGAAVKNASPSFASTWELIDQLPDTIASKIAGENAARIYHIQ